MQWLEMMLRVPPELSDVAADLLEPYGHQGVSVEYEGYMPDAYINEPLKATAYVVRAYIPDDDRADEIKAEVEKAASALNIRPVFKLVDDENWAEAWKVHYHTTRIGKRMVVRPRWEDYDLQPDDIEIALDPGMAFGSGTHPTTQLCLAALEDVTQHGVNVLDLGCGSGILAIGAAKLGATKVYGFDIDPIAVKVTAENAEMNGVGHKIIAEQGGLEAVLHSARRFDLVVVNILARIIIPMCEQGLGQLVRPGGKAIFSGLIKAQEEDVRQALIATGLTPYNVRYLEDWVLIETYRADA